MIKKHLKTLLLTSAVILLPILAGVILWDKLPDSVPVHFGPTGEADGFAGRGVAVIFDKHEVRNAAASCCRTATPSSPSPIPRRCVRSPRNSL